MFKKTIFKLTSSLVLALSLSAAAVAADDDDDPKWYQIEIIIFEHTIQIEDSTEIWPSDPGLPDPTDTHTLSLAPTAASPETKSDPDHTLMDPLTGLLLQNSTTQTLAIDQLPTDITTVSLLPQDEAKTAPAIATTTAELPFQLLDPQQYQLNDLHEKLANDAAYIPLLHLAWRQPVLSRDGAQAISISSALLNKNANSAALLEAESNQTSAAGENDIATAESPNPTLLEIPPATAKLLTETMEAVSADETSAQLASDGPPAEKVRQRIEGTIRITLGRYLHVQLDLLYRPEQPPQKNVGFFSFLAEDPEPDAYRLTQHRRVRSGELHYFDHPKVGVVTLITPYELPTAEEAVTSTETATTN